MSLEFRADLHCHSSLSDGSDAPLDLLNLAHKNNLQGLSITDHDTIEAYSKSFFEKAKELNIELLTGVEVSTAFEEQTIHILGYGFDLTEDFFSFLSEIQKMRGERNRQILEKLKIQGIDLSFKDLPDQLILGRPHIAKILVEKGFVGTFREAFERFLKEGASCFVPGFKKSPLDAILAIRKSGGKAVLAHPFFYRKKLIKKLLQLPFDGVECYYGNLPSYEIKPWLQRAKEKGWIATGGSDYHGSFKPYISLGESTVDRHTFEKLQKTH